MSRTKSLVAAVLAVASVGAFASEVTFFADPPSVRSRAEVIAEVLQARASGELAALRGEASPFPEAVLAAARSRDARVRQAGIASGTAR